jgi:hypothetical protein
MDTIWNCAFGLDIDIQNNPENDYFNKAEQVFSDTVNLNLLSYIGGRLLQFELIHEI